MPSPPRRQATSASTAPNDPRATVTLSATDAFLKYPGSQLVVALLADKWTIPVIHALARGTRRTGALKAELVGVSQKMLTQTLRRLEAHGLIERKIFPVVPPHVEYSLTAMGISMNEPLAGICAWVERHGAALVAEHARAGRTRGRRKG